MKNQVKTSTGSQKKACQNCKKEFFIEPEDLAFYQKMSSSMGTEIPLPTWCPQCRMIRRFSFENTWNLYWRSCDKCGEKTLSMFPPEQKLLVYCQRCWWADGWDGTEYGIDYDPEKPFLDQVMQLKEKTPFASLTSLYSSLKNSEYSNALAWSRDCYIMFWADFCDNVYYSSILNGLKHSLDCLRGFKSELCYESIGFSGNYRTFFSDECDNCVDVWFSRNCYGCTDCIGCVNLRGVSNCIFNERYSKEGYKRKVKELNLNSWKSMQEVKKKAFEFWQKRPWREYSGNSLNVNVSGEYVYESRNSKEMYIVNGTEDCKWSQFITVKPAKDCWDYSGWGNNADRIYEASVAGEDSSRICFSCECWPDCLNLQYCYWNIAGKNNFGCVNLKRKKYCILNKEYSREEYEKLKAKIIEDMKKRPFTDKLGREFYYGEFFPLEFSNFPYNKSNAMRFFPKTKKQAEKEGYTWIEESMHEYSISISADELPDTIEETTESILSKVIQCSSCPRGYKIVKGELDLMRKLGLPIPHECPRCREEKRFARLNKPEFFNRQCKKCRKNIYSAFSPDRPEIVYCEKCYQQEFL